MSLADGLKYLPFNWQSGLGDSNVYLLSPRIGIKSNMKSKYRQYRFPMLVKGLASLTVSIAWWADRTLNNRLKLAHSRFC